MVNSPLAIKRGESREALRAELTAPMLLASVYAPARARDAWLCVLALDRRFARIVAEASEPMLAQVQIAWWRETLSRPPAEWPGGEPILSGIAQAGVSPGPLRGMADGWEALVGERLGAAELAAAANGRAAAFGALAKTLGEGEGAAVRAGYRWALADFGMHISDAGERASAAGLLAAAAPAPPLGRAMRPLAVLRTLAERAFGEQRLVGGWRDFLRAVRLGLVGR